MLNPYLFYQDTCEAAFNFYAKALGGKIGAIMRVSDAPPEHHLMPQGFAVSVTVADPAEGERKFNALAEGGTVTMPFSKTFWAKGFGMCVDKFGIPWMVICPAVGM